MLSKFIDQTNLKPNATIEDIDKLIIETWKYDFYGICISSCWTKYVVETLKWINENGIDKINKKPEWDFVINNWKSPQKLNIQNKIKVVTVVGFPLGNDSIISKVDAAKNALSDGADEIDMVINIGMFLSNQFEYIKKEINSVKKECNNHILKVIIETCYYNEKQLAEIVKIINETNTDFIKTSTGFGPRGVTLNDVQIIKENINVSKKIKAAGGISNFETCHELIELGVERIGTSSGTKIIKKE